MKNNSTENTKAVLYSAAKPDEEQKKRFLSFLKSKYHTDISLEWVQNDGFPGGFRLEVGSEIYDWSVNGRFQQLKDTLASVPRKNGNVIPLIRETLQKWMPEAVPQELVQY